MACLNDFTSKHSWRQSSALLVALRLHSDFATSQPCGASITTKLRSCLGDVDADIIKKLA